MAGKYCVSVEVHYKMVIIFQSICASVWAERHRQLVTGATNSADGTNNDNYMDMIFIIAECGLKYNFQL